VAEAFKPEPRAKTALDNRKLSLTAPHPKLEGVYSSLNWMLVNNNPRIVVYTNDPDENGNPAKNYGKITANLDLGVFASILTELKRIIESKEADKCSVDNFNYVYTDGVRADKPSIVSTLWFGKDEDGVIWISVTAKDRPAIRFTFAPSTFHHFKKADGTDFTTAEASQLFAKSYLRILENIMSTLAVTEYVEPVKKEFNKSPNQSSSWANKKSVDDVVSDIPF